VKTEAEVVLVELREAGFTGRGEGVPYARYGETVDAVLAQLESVRPQIEAGLSRAALQALLPPGSARNALDCAMWDLALKAEHRSAPWPQAPIATALTVSLDSALAMAEAASALADAPLLKVKVSAEDPLSRIRAVREAAPRARLIVDPNESWSFALLADLLPHLQALRVDLVEQPLPADADAELDGFHPAVPLAADETFHGAGDVALVARRYQVANIKLDKTGGLTAALAAAQAVRAAGLGLMVGCMVCSSLSIAPALAFAAEADFVDLDGPIWLASDRPGGVTVRNGLLSPPQPGFWGA
jgi:L-alanine-DL-glutamate epimerase-like enolase superfamily enzyme